MFSTSGDVQYIRACSVHPGDIMSTPGGIISTSRDVQCIGGISWFMRGDIMIHAGELIDKSF